MIRKLMLLLSMAAVMSLALGGTAFAQPLVEVDAFNPEAAATGGAGGAGGDATNNAEVNQANVIAQSNEATQNQDQAAYVKAYKSKFKVTQAQDASVAQANVASDNVQVNAASVEQEATGGAGGAGGDAAAIAANVFLLDLGL